MKSLRLLVLAVLLVMVMATVAQGSWENVVWLGTNLGAA